MTVALSWEKILGKSRRMLGRGITLNAKGIDSSESQGGLSFFAKSSYSELELRDSSLGFGQLFSKRRPLPAMSQAHSLLFPAPSHSRNLISSVGNFSFFDFTRHIRCRGTALSCDTGSVTRHHCHMTDQVSCDSCRVTAQVLHDRVSLRHCRCHMTGVV